MKYIKLFEDEYYLIAETKKYFTEIFEGDSDVHNLSWEINTKLIKDKIQINIEIEEPYDDGAGVISIHINPKPLSNWINGLVEDFRADYYEEFNEITEEDVEQDDNKFYFQFDCYLKEHLARSIKASLWDLEK
jgi:hypothetical protein